MVTILKNEDNLGSQIGQGLGSALGAGLASLASHKVESMKNKHLEQRLVKDGFEPKMASLLVSIGPKAREEYFKTQFDYHKFENQPQRQQQAQQNIQPMQPQQMQQQQPVQPVNPKAVPKDLQMQGKPNTMDILRSLGTAPVPQDYLKGMPQQQAPQQQMQQPVAQQQATIPSLEQPTPNERFGQAAAQQQIAQQVAEQQGLSKPRVDALERQKELEDYKQQRKEHHALAMYERKRMDEQEDKSKDIYASELQKTHGLKEQLARLNRQEALNKSGKLSHQTLVAARDTVAKGLSGLLGIPGVDFTHLLSPESQEFEKLSKDMLSGLKDMYGARINQVEVESFLKTIPSLMQSTDGRQAVIENMKHMIESKLLWTDAAKEIKKENGGRIPGDLQFQVEERIAPQLDAFADSFKNLSHEKVEKKNEGLIKSALKAIPRAIV